jgi:hypothetical protein
VKQQLINEMEYYSLTIWISKTMQNFMALMLHYLSGDFEMNIFILEVKSLQGSHTGSNIRLCLELSMRENGLNIPHLTLLLHYSASAYNEAKKSTLGVWVIVFI